MPPGTPGPTMKRCAVLILPPDLLDFGGDVILNRFGLGAGLLRGRFVVAAMALVALAGCGVCVGSHSVSSARAGMSTVAMLPGANGAPKAPSPTQALQTIGQLPIMFEPNVGQTDERVRFMARGAHYGLFLTKDEAVLSLR